MNRFLLFTLMIFLFSCGTNDLEDKVQTIELEYIPWSCDCANWVTIEDMDKFDDNRGDSLSRLSIFVEPADPSLALPDTIGYINDRIRFTGRFYKEKGFPKGFKSSEPADKSRVFRYTKYEILNSGYNKRVTE